MKVLQIRKQLRQRNLPYTNAEPLLREQLIDAMIEAAGLGKYAPASASQSDPASNVRDDGIAAALRTFIYDPRIKTHSTNLRVAIPQDIDDDNSNPVAINEVNQQRAKIVPGCHANIRGEYLLVCVSECMHSLGSFLSFRDPDGRCCS